MWAALAVVLPLAAGATEVKDIEYRKFIDAFHLTDFIDNKADLTSIIRFQYELQPENKEMTWRDASFAIDGVEYRPDRYWSLDLPVSAELYARNPTVTRTTKFPGKFSFGMGLVVVGPFAREVPAEKLSHAKAHYDDLVAHAGFTVRNFAPDMSLVKLRGDDPAGRCLADGNEAKARSFGEAGEVSFKLKEVTKGVSCSSPISSVLLSDD